MNYFKGRNINCMCACILTEKAVAPHSSTLAWKIPWMRGGTEGADRSPHQEMLPKSQAGDAYSRAGTAIRDTRGDVTCTGRGFGKLIMYQFHLVLSATQRF